jgi:hypothetical protein
MNVITKDNENFVLADTTVEMIYQEIDMIRSGAILTWVDAF